MRLKLIITAVGILSILLLLPETIPSVYRQVCNILKRKEKIRNRPIKEAI